MPMPNVVVQTTASATTNAAAAAKTGLQRAATHNNRGKIDAGGTTATHSSRGSKTMSPLTTVTIATATPPSMASLSGGGSRITATSPIRSGATVIMPKASDANQWYQIVKKDVDVSWNSLKPNVPPIPEMTVATIAAATSAMTLRGLSRLNDEPKYLSMSMDTTTGSAALHRAKTMVLHMLRSPKRLATMVAAIVPIMTGNRACGPRPMSTPAETPAAGQKTATPSGRIR